MSNDEIEKNVVAAAVTRNRTNNDTISCLPTPLSTNAILSAMDMACAKVWSTGGLTEPSSVLPNIRWKRQYFDHTNFEPNHHSLLYSIVGALEHDDDDEEIIPVFVARATFYFAYSTWDGRIVYIDNIHIDDSVTIAENDNSTNTTTTTEQYRTQITSIVCHILANIAITLSCRRLTWQHTKEQTIVFPNTVTTQPQTLHGWLTLHWNRDAIIQFLGGNTHSSTTGTILTSSSFRNSIEATLQQRNAAIAQPVIIESSSEMKRPSRRRLRLADTNDVHTIGRLVQGLADFEKEPDAVHVTPNHYQMDGFQSDPPLFYCLLLEVSTNTTVDHNVEEMDDTNDWYACGMAFCWIGSRQDVSHTTSMMIQPPESLFLYLEDLFIEEAYRGNGAGTFVMTTLGEIALSLNCNKMVWQALDWNTPALTFYQNKIGAHIVDGLLTTRFAGPALHEFNDCE